MITYSDSELRSIFQSSFNKEKWISVLRNLFCATQLKTVWEPLQYPQEDIVGYHIGSIETKDYYSVGLFYYDVKRGSVDKRKVSLRNLVRGFTNPRWGRFDAALVVFNSRTSWRLSLIADIEGENTDPKRYTYVFGKNALSYRTAISRFDLIQKEGISFENLKKAFSVEALSEDFFKDYRKIYADFVQFITGTRYEEVNGKFIEVRKCAPNEMFARSFGNDTKCVRDYIKKMMGRITFLHFLQRKGWMNGDLNYMKNLFEGSQYKEDYLDKVLEPLFHGILNTKPENRASVFQAAGWNMDFLKEWQSIPYLNGGLFERDSSDEAEVVFPTHYFADLFNFFSQYNFTIDENDPNDAEVGVDPEMLGIIFENLLEDNKDKGAFYTPKEIVQYMCRESLIAYLHKSTNLAVNEIRSFVSHPDETNFTESIKKRIETALREVKICDPAIGSGAFPMGLLNELLRCREGLSASVPNRAELKKDIISTNIYGVDIEKGAVDIARLRFWLSIVVDEDIPSPLPNLDYKIMQGNSLLEEYRGINLSQFNLPTNKQVLTKSRRAKVRMDWLGLDEKDTLDNIQGCIKEYYSTDDHERKHSLRDFINSHIKQYIKCLLSDAHEEIETLPIPNDKFFLWHIYFKDVFDNGGFDIVIGNPPYIDSETMVRCMPELRQIYKRKFRCASGNWDMFIIFIEQELNLLKKNGIFSNIVPNKILAAPYAIDLRKRIAESTLLEVRDYSRLDIFKNAAVYPVTLVMKNECNEQEQTTYSTMKSCDTVKSSLHVSAEYASKFDFWDVFFRDEKIVSLIKKINAHPSISSLSDVSVCGAAATSEAYLIKPLIQDSSECFECFKFVNSGTIDCYRPLWGVKQCKYLKDNYQHPCIAALALEQFSQNRFKQANSPKIIVASMTKRFEAIIDVAGHYMAGKTTTIIQAPIEKLYLIAAILNSKLASFWLNTVFNSLKMAGGALPIGKHEINLLPVADYSAEHKSLNECVKGIINAIEQNPNSDISLYENALNDCVYKLYNLTPEEIRIVEDSSF